MNVKEFEKELMKISKPGSYLPLEMNLLNVSFDERPVRFILCYPDLYEIGMSHAGGKILYHVINNLTDFALCHRVYLPKPDMQAFLKEKKFPLYALESMKPVKDYDFLGFSLLTELVYTNVLKVLELSHIPLRASERGEEFPIIQAGGTCTLNPVLLSPFIDLFVIGDGEEVMVELARLMKEKKELNLSKREFLERAVDLEGVYVPSLGKRPVKKAVFHGLKKEFYPVSPVVPSVEIVHDRIVVEAMRGCLRGCRYCQAGFAYRPYRERSVDEIVSILGETFENTGYEEASLLSLSISDHSKFNELIPSVMKFCNARMIGLSLPSMRVKGFNPDLATQLMRIRKSSFTIAPEAATERLRKVINKDLSEEDILSLVDGLFERGWSKLKFYFMIGLPTETDKDIEALAGLLWKIYGISRKYKGRKHLAAGFSIFVPKPFTPFQWERFISLEEARKKIDYIKEHAPRSFKLRFHAPEMSLLEALLTRGDEKMAEVLEMAFKYGACLDSWEEHFRFDIWQRAFKEVGIDIEKEIGEKTIDEPLPWDFIKGVVSKKFLLKEREKAYREERTPDCRIVGCHGCGACTSDEITKLKEFPIPEKVEFSLPPVKKREFPLVAKVAFFFEKKGKSRFLSLLDINRVFTRIFRRFGIPVKYQGRFNPHPRFSILLGIPTGVESKNEIIEVELYEEFTPDNGLIERFNSVLPEGLRFKKAVSLGKKESLLKKVKEVIYRIEDDFDIGMVKDILVSQELKNRKGKMVQVSPLVADFSVSKGIIELHLNVVNGRILNIQDFLFWIGKDLSSVSVEREIVVGL
ncbi:TIGR03936 family radical SAM-associated protein [Desulfurobacterium indicum]|uniref:Radical SAM protein n=1 Tax=Desulfurobacterium indicum TaxID=1914305 RepID=A0A1R1MLQ8_9BACT|nr:TIGR03936 family radical SAM-associated protein [Desulfurobacterium indicum]OMH40689.1 radical SAM protein [Desulfurobacterium indicum]